MKTNELTGAALDWAVAKCLNVDEYILNESFMTRWTDDDDECVNYHYSTDWAQGGPIIERERICSDYLLNGQWLAVSRITEAQGYGPTPLIAAMRCYVASKLGDDIEIPKELL